MLSGSSGKSGAVGFGVLGGLRLEGPVEAEADAVVVVRRGGGAGREEPFSDAVLAALGCTVFFGRVGSDLGVTGRDEALAPRCDIFGVEGCDGFAVRGAGSTDAGEVTVVAFAEAPAERFAAALGEVAMDAVVRPVVGFFFAAEVGEEAAVREAVRPDVLGVWVEGFFATGISGRLGCTGH